MVNGAVVSNNGTVYRMATVEDVKAYFDAGFTFICGDDADYMTYRSIGHAVGDGYSEIDENGYYLNSDGIKLLNLVKEYCDTYGVPYEKAKVLVKSLYLEGAMGGEQTHSDGMIKANLTKMYSALKKHPCFGGFIVRDEPRGRMAATYNYWYKWLVEDLGVYRDGYILYGALLGMNAAEVHVAAGATSDTDGNFSPKFGLTADQYQAYLNLFIAGLTKNEKETLCFDYYPFMETIRKSLISGNEISYSMLGQYFQNLEIMARTSEENGFRRCLCVQSIAFYNKKEYEKTTGRYTYHGKVTEEMMTYQLYSALAYGYDQAAYFTYMQPYNQTDNEWFTEGAYMWQQQADGSYKAVPTDTYTAVKNANAEIIVASRIMAGYNWLGTTYSVGNRATANIFGGTSSYSSRVLTGISSSYDAIAGCLEDENGNYGFMVVNSDDPRNARTNEVTLTFGTGFDKVVYYDNGVKKVAELNGGKITLNIGAGKGIFIIPEASGVDFEITAPVSGATVYPYADNVKNYLSRSGSDVADCMISGQKDAVAPVTVGWNNVLSGVTEYRVEYSVNADFSDPILIETNPSQTSVELYNLYKATKYYVRVTAVTSLGNKYAFSTFETADLGPRTMKIDGIYNVRDLGGYMTESGERTAQGRFFRGGAVSESTWTAYAGIALSEEGKAYMRDVLGIKTDFDLRGAAENLNLTESSIPNATLEYYNVGGYLEAFNNTSGYKKVFSALADESRYPVYMHCTGGADRTGTVSFLINALCGVDEATLIKDYEMTSFSVYGERNSKTTEYDFAKFVARLKTYTGNTLSEKTENYMKSIGLTDTEIYNIRAIMFGKAVK